MTFATKYSPEISKLILSYTINELTSSEFFQNINIILEKAKELYPYCGESLLLFIDNFSFEYDEYPIITEKELVYTSLRLKRILNEKAFDHAIFYYSSGW